MFKPIALTYSEEQKRPIWIGYTGKKIEGLTCHPPYTVSTHTGPISTDLKTIDEVRIFIRQHFSADPSFKWLPLYDLNSLVD